MTILTEEESAPGGHNIIITVVSIQSSYPSHRHQHKKTLPVFSICLPVINLEASAPCRRSEQHPETTQGVEEAPQAARRHSHGRGKRSGRPHFSAARHGHVSKDDGGQDCHPPRFKADCV